jgi:hypothetical protein
VTVYRWSEAKNARLKRERGVTLEEIVVAIDAGHLLDVITHRNPRRYPHQSMFVVVLQRYIYLVPFVEQSDALFLRLCRQIVLHATFHLADGKQDAVWR